MGRQHSGLQGASQENRLKSARTAATTNWAEKIKLKEKRTVDTKQYVEFFPLFRAGSQFLPLIGIDLKTHILANN